MLLLTIAWMIIMLLVFLIFFLIYKNVSNSLRVSTQGRLIFSQYFVWVILYDTIWLISYAASVILFHMIINKAYRIDLNQYKDLLTNSIVAITQVQAAFANVQQILPIQSTADITSSEIKNPFWRKIYSKSQFSLWFRWHIHSHTGIINDDVPASHFRAFNIIPT